MGTVTAAEGGPGNVDGRSGQRWKYWNGTETSVMS